MKSIGNNVSVCFVVHGKKFRVNKTERMITIERKKLIEPER